MRFATCALALLLAVPAAASTYTLKPDGTGDFATIQDAVDAAADGDEILLENGTYTGDRNRAVSYVGKAITIRSVSGDPTSCVIDGENVSAGFFGVGFEFVSGEPSEATLEGISITRMNGAFGPAGSIRIHNSSATIRNVIITGTSSYSGLASGPVIWIQQGSAEIRECAIKSNSGDGVGLGASTAALTGCVIEANSSSGSDGGAIVAVDSDVTLESCAIRRNTVGGLAQGPYRGGGVVLKGGSLAMTGCLVTENTADDFGGGIFAEGGAVLNLDRVTIAGNRSGTGGGIYGTSFSATVTSSILWGNCATVSGSEVYADAGANLTFSCSTVDSAGIAGPGVIILNSDVVYLNPLFCQPRTCSDPTGVTGIYSLQQVSPVHPLPGCGFLGAILQPCSVAIAPLSWGRVKASFR